MDIKVSTFQELQCVVAALKLDSVQVKDLLYDAEAAYFNHQTFLNDILKKILESTSEKHEEITSVCKESTSKNQEHYSSILNSAVIDQDRLDDSGYISYLLQKYPELYGYEDRKTGKILDFNHLSWYSVLVVCEKHTHLAGHVNLLEGRSFTDDHGNNVFVNIKLNKNRRYYHKAIDIIVCILRMKNLKARSKILKNFLSSLYSPWLKLEVRLYLCQIFLQKIKDLGKTENNKVEEDNKAFINRFEKAFKRFDRY